MTAISKLLAGAMLIFAVTACTPEVGSDQWCSKMKATPTGDWTANQAANFAKHCLLK